MGDLYYLGNARSEDQHAEMIRLEESKTCLFCPDGLVSSEKNIYWNNDWWSLTSNDYPYKSTLHHLLLVPTRHITDMIELTPDELQSLKPAIKFAKRKFKFEYYGLGARNGDPAYTGGTIRHLHLHLIVGDPDADEPVKLKLSSKPK